MASNFVTSNFACFGLLLFFCGLHFSEEACNDTLVTQKAYFDVYIGDDYWGRIVIGMFGDTTPITALNFFTFASNHNGVGYSNTIFHRAYNFAILGGDVVKKLNTDGSGSMSIFNNGEEFPDENFIFRNKPGWIGMANRGPNTNGCQFYINTATNSWLDGQNVVFAKVLTGMDVVYKIGSMPVDSNNRPTTNCTVAWTGTFSPLVPYSVPY